MTQSKNALARSSNPSSNAGALDRTTPDYREHIGAAHPNHRTASDGFDTDRGRLSIRGSGRARYVPDRRSTHG